MKKSRFLAIILPVTALVCEILPYGAVLNFWNPEGKPFRETFSYFDLTPFGYANFAPLITAVLTCVILLLTILFLIKPKKSLSKAIIVLSELAFAVSLMPLIYGINYFTSVSIVISASLFLNGILMYFISKYTSL